MSLFVYPPINVSITGVATEATLQSIDTAVGSINTKLTTITDRLGGSLVPSKYDAIVPTIGATTDVYVYKTGGVGGTTVRTITITYVDATKAVIASVVAV